MRRLKLTLLYNTLKDNYFIIVVFFIINLLIYKGHYILIIFDIFYLIYLFIKNIRFATVITVLLFILFFNICIRNYIFNKTYNENIEGVLKVEKIIKYETSYQVYFKYKNVKILSYVDESLEIGSSYYIKGKLSKASTPHYKNGFNYYDYLKNKNIIGILEIDNYKFIKKGISIYYLNHIINEYLDNTLQTSSKGIVKALTIGEKKDLDDNLSTSISEIGISHLFVISGLHVNMIASFLLFILKKIKIKENIISIITIIILFIYYMICGYLISILRVILSYIIKSLNKKYLLEFSNVDIISLNIILVLLINPFLIFQYSFSLSYIISTSIIICNKIINSKGKLKNLKSSLKISILSILVTIPVIVKINPTINILSIIYNIFYIPFVTYIMLPLSFLVVAIPYFEKIYQIIYSGFYYITNLLSEIKILNISFSTPSIFIIVIYYFILYMILLNFEKKRINYKWIISFFMLLIMWNNIAFLNINNEVYFLDLPKGEATFIRQSFNRQNILIDTGENGYDDIVLFLKSLGIKRIDMIFISHSDSDHNGMLDEIIEEFEVKIIYTNPYDDLTMKIARRYNIKYQPLYKNNVIKKNDIYFKVISPSKDFNNANDNSMVLFANIFKTKYLFTGDISSNIEEGLDVNNLEIDVLKLAHHGSNTSTSSKFLDMLDINKNKKIVICMNGYKNTFSFPTSNTVKKIKTNLYITSITKTICIRNNIFLKQNRIKLL